MIRSQFDPKEWYVNSDKRQYSKTMLSKKLQGDNVYMRKNVVKNIKENTIQDAVLSPKFYKSIDALAPKTETRPTSGVESNSKLDIKCID